MSQVHLKKPRKRKPDLKIIKTPEEKWTPYEYKQEYMRLRKNLQNKAYRARKKGIDTTGMVPKLVKTPTEKSIERIQKASEKTSKKLNKIKVSKPIKPKTKKKEESKNIPQPPTPEKEEAIDEAQLVIESWKETLAGFATDNRESSLKRSERMIRTAHGWVDECVNTYGSNIVARVLKPTIARLQVEILYNDVSEPRDNWEDNKTGKRDMYFALLSDTMKELARIKGTKNSNIDITPPNWEDEDEAIFQSLTEEEKITLQADYEHFYE